MFRLRTPTVRVICRLNPGYITYTKQFWRAFGLKVLSLGGICFEVESQKSEECADGDGFLPCWLFSFVHRNTADISLVGPIRRSLYKWHCTGSLGGNESLSGIQLGSKGQLDHQGVPSAVIWVELGLKLNRTVYLMPCLCVAWCSASWGRDSGDRNFIITSPVSLPSASPAKVFT